MELYSTAPCWNLCHFPSATSVPELTTETDSKSSFSRQIVAVLLSMLIPGAGHFLLKRRGLAYILVTVFLVFLACFWPFRILRYYWGFLTLCLLGVVLSLSSGISACIIAKGTARAGKFWIIPVAILSSFGFLPAFQLATRAAGFRIFAMPSTSMERTINAGDRIVVDTRYFSHESPMRKEILVFQHEG
jgi:hypothetical protein